LITHIVSAFSEVQTEYMYFRLFSLWLYLGTGSQSPTCHHGGLHSLPGQSMWDIWWTEWHWDMFLSTSVFLCQYLTTSAPYSSSVYMTRGWSLGTIKAVLFWM